ncbi:hypothetical protein [Micromonospora sp. NPDC047730]|uniref:hypothetical protein n=1 Tax=Micromonospora sp. NPDC047730 TaxID=3364253 RepID=UPI003711A906
MGNNIADRRDVAVLTVRGRGFRVERIAWKNSDGLSFDVHDVATGVCLTAESYDWQPREGDVVELLDRLKSGLEDGTLDPLDHDRAELATVLGIELLHEGDEDGGDDEGGADGREVNWQCPGCFAVFYVGEEDLAVDHVQIHCDKVDGAGRALS